MSALRASDKKNIFLEGEIGSVMREGTFLCTQIMNMRPHRVDSKDTEQTADVHADLCLCCE